MSLFKPIENTPRWLIGILLVLPTLIADWDGELHERLSVPFDFVPLVWIVGICVPGAIHRRNYRHFVIALAVGVTVFVVNHAIIEMHPAQASLFVFVAIHLNIIFAVGGIEWICSDNRSWLLFVWIGLMCLSTASTFCVVQRFVEYSLCPANGMWQQHTLWRRFLVFWCMRWLLLTVLAWVAVTLAERLAAQRSLMVRVTASLTALLVFLIFICFYNYMIFELGKRSLAGDGPFPRLIGAVLLDIRRNESDYEFMLNQLAIIDATESIDPDGFNWRELCAKVCRAHYGDDFPRLVEEKRRILRER